MTRSQATPASSQIITLTRLLEATQDALDKERAENAALREAAQEALDALVYHREQTRPIDRTDAAVERLRTALEAK